MAEAKGVAFEGSVAVTGFDTRGGRVHAFGPITAGSSANAC